MSIRRNVDELCKLTGLDRKHIQHILEKGVEIGALKKISDEDYEMTDMGMNIGSKINFKNFQNTDPGVWKCTKCKTINNALNGPNCLKCNYSYVDSLASDILRRESKEYKFPKINDREILIFLIGHLTGMAIGFPPPKSISFKQKMEHQNTVAVVLAELTSKVVDQFPHISNDEFDEILLQLNAMRTMPFLEDAMKKMRKGMS